MNVFNDQARSLKKGHRDKGYDEIAEYGVEDVMEDMGDYFDEESLANYDFIEDEVTEYDEEDMMENMEEYFEVAEYSEEEQKGTYNKEHNLGHGKEKSAVLKAQNHQPINEEGSDLDDLWQDHSPTNGDFEKSIMTRASTRANYGYRADVSMYGLFYNRIEVEFEKKMAKLLLTLALVSGELEGVVSVEVAIARWKRTLKRTLDQKSPHRSLLEVVQWALDTLLCFLTAVMNM
mmetsp:Transcript_15385/g.23588  ORF Transcript_15385/g.23588 Transcript_15385/m.23588 type:complete len:233 (-) Transcript_15385:68-766(-)